jgi:hypothetical protein
MDVAWIGFSLHHLLGPAKLEIMREVRSVVGDRGLFLIYETASPDGEDRDAWLTPLNVSGSWAANRGPQCRTALRTPCSAAASRTSSPHYQQCGRWEFC